jgi:hypothetical protein
LPGGVELAQSLEAGVARGKVLENTRKRPPRAGAANRAVAVPGNDRRDRTPMNGCSARSLSRRHRSTSVRPQLVQNLVIGQALPGSSTTSSISKIEAGQFEACVVDFDPRDLVAEVTDLFCALQQGLDSSISLPRTCPGG